MEKPLIVGSIRQNDEQSAINDIIKSEADGAKAFILHIQLLDEKYRNYDSFKRIKGASGCPIMAIYYRTQGGLDDDRRIEVMREALRAGFNSVDIPMYTYDDDPQNSLFSCGLPFASANPYEVSMDPGIIVKQKKLIQEYKEMGAEVLMSAHVGVELSCEQAVSLGLEIQSRGADIVKIITSCESKKQQLIILNTNMELNKILRVPYLYTCGGNKYSRFIRFNAPLFGSLLVFGHHEHDKLSNKEKPLLKDIAQYYYEGDK